MSNAALHPTLEEQFLNRSLQQWRLFTHKVKQLASFDLREVERNPFGKTAVQLNRFLVSVPFRPLLLS